MIMNVSGSMTLVGATALMFLMACGGAPDSSSGRVQAALGSPEPGLEKEVPADEDPQVPPTCSDLGFQCAVLIDKESPCASGLAARWELACGEADVCCGDPVAATDPCDEVPDDPKCTNPTGP